MSSAAHARACVRELSGFAPDGRPELGLGVSGEYLNQQTNQIRFYGMCGSVCHTIPSMQVNVPMGKTIDLYSVESEIDTNGFTLVAHWHDMQLNMHEVLGSNPGILQTF